MTCSTKIPFTCGSPMPNQLRCLSNFENGCRSKGEHFNEDGFIAGIMPRLGGCNADSFNEDILRKLFRFIDIDQGALELLWTLCEELQEPGRSLLPNTKRPYSNGLCPSNHSWT